MTPENNTETPTDKNKVPETPQKKDAPLRKLPKNFPKRLAEKILYIVVRNVTKTDTNIKIWELLFKHINTPQMFGELFRTMELFREKSASEEYVYLLWNSILDHHRDTPESRNYFDLLIEYMIQEHGDKDSPPYSDSLGTSKHSMMAHFLGEAFLIWVKSSTEQYRMISLVYANIIEMELKDVDLKEDPEKKGSNMLGYDFDSKEHLVYNKKYFFEALVGYMVEDPSDQYGNRIIRDTDQYKTSLIEEMLRVRKNTIQRIIHYKVKQLEKQRQRDIDRQTANPEELLAAIKPFRNSLGEFVREKTYNRRYLAIENMRSMLQILPGVIAFILAVLGFLNLGGIGIEGIFVFVAMSLYGLVLYHKKTFKQFLPKDNVSEMQFAVEEFLPYLKKMSKIQLSNFLHQEVYEMTNLDNYIYIPELLNYIYSVIPNKENMLCNGNDYFSVLQLLEVNVNRKKSNLPASTPSY